MLAVQGPNARQVLSAQLHIELPPRMKVVTRQIGRRPAIVCGTGYTGEDGVELLIDPEIAPAIWAELVDAGIVPCGLGARDTLRLEACYHLHGNDLSAGTDPISAGLGWACVESTGFIGCDRVAVFRANGTDEILVPFAIEGEGIPRPGNPVLLGEETVGEVSSGTFSPSLGAGIGMAYVRSDLASGHAARSGRARKASDGPRKLQASLPEGKPGDLNVRAELPRRPPLPPGARLGPYRRRRSDPRNHLVRAGLAGRGRLLRRARGRLRGQARTSPTPRSSRSRRSPT